MALAGFAAAAVPDGWIALRYDPPAPGEQKGHWIIVKEPADGLAAWWSDAELARIVANDPAYVKRLETDWNPVDHPVADADEAERLAAELARYWGGDVPQANYWAHGAMTRRGATLRAYRWEQDGAAQRTALEQAGDRPVIPAAALDPDPVDQRYDNQADVVTYGDRWGDHLLTGTLDHVYRAELNKAKRRHHPNPPPATEVTRKAKATVQACRTESLKAEMGVFENYVRGWGGLAAKSVSFGLPANCVADPGPPVAIVNPPALYTACDGSTHSTQAAANAVQCTSTPRTYTACDGSTHSTQAAANAVRCTTNPRTYTACDGSSHSTQAAANAIRCTTNPRSYTACDGSSHSTQAAANAIRCTTNPRTYTACDGSRHSSQAAAQAVRCTTNPPITNPPTTTTPPTTNPDPPTTNPGCTISWLCGNDPDPNDPDPDPDPDPDTTNPGTEGGTDTDNGGGADTGGGNGGNGGGGGGGNQPVADYEACDGSMHSTQASADAVNCDPQPPIEYFDCEGDPHDTQAKADAVSCDTTYTACDGSEHKTQAAANSVDCSLQERQQILHDLTCEGTVDENTGQCDDLIYTP